MSKVEMSLQEYDELKAKIAFYERVFDTIFTIKCDKWDLEWFHDHDSSSLDLHSEDLLQVAPKDIKKFIEERIFQAMDECIEEHNINGMEINSDESFRISFGAFRHIQEAEES